MTIKSKSRRKWRNTEGIGKIRNACISMRSSEGYRGFGSDGKILLRPLRE
jgi:hypothetical protein